MKNKSASDVWLGKAADIVPERRSSAPIQEPPLTHGELRTIPQLSRLLHLSQKQIRDYVAEGCPVAIRAKAPTPHQINTADFFHWCIAKRDADNRIRKKASGGPVDDTKERIQKAIADRKEFELAKAKEGFADVRDWGPFVEDVLVRMREMFIRMAERFREEVPEAKPMETICGFMVSDITAMLNQVSKGLKAIPEEAKKEPK